jgi:hypothetical protein
MAGRNGKLPKPTKAELARFKVPPVEVECSDYELFVGRELDDNGDAVVAGERYTPHKGERIMVMPVSTMGSMFGLTRLVGPDDEEADGVLGEGDDAASQAVIADAMQRRLARQAQAFEQIITTLARRVVWWDWTDLGGEPLPQPYRNPEAITGLDPSEIFYLQRKLSGETAVAEGNVVRGSDSGSLEAPKSRGS